MTNRVKHPHRSPVPVNKMLKETYSNLTLPLPPTARSQYFIKPRSFNSITSSRTTVIKTSSHASITGELFFYLNVPHDIRHLFPRLHHYHMSANNSSQLVTSLVMQRIHGTTLSEELIRGRMTSTMLRRLLETLHVIHSSQGMRCEASRDPGMIYENYARKVSGRFETHKEIYERVGLTKMSHFDDLTKRLRCFENERRGLPVRVVHGDPVLTNVMLSKEDCLLFIDMRGAQGSDCFTLEGDAVYDLAKVFQSLCGYDFILTDSELGERSVKDLEELRTMFEQFVATLYPNVQFEDILLATCSLYTSLIPLHDNERHRRLFSLIARGMLHVLCRESANYSSERGRNLDEFLRKIAKLSIERRAMQHVAI